MQWINTLIGVPLGYLMWTCLGLMQNYGWAILLFTLLTKVIQFPLGIWVQKNSIKMVRLQPQVNRILARHMGNKDRAAEEQMALYKREGYRPLMGTIPMLIQIPIILGLLSVIYHPLQHLLHLDADIIATFVEKASQLSGTDLGMGAQLRVIELIQGPFYTGAFSVLQGGGGNVSAAISLIQGMDLQFGGWDLSQVPTFAFTYALWVPFFSGASALVLCVLQNKENVLQREQGFWGKWGVTCFLTAFSAYFAFLVPIGVSIYWIAGNLFSMVSLYLLNWMYDPKKEIDYQALEESKKQLWEERKIAPKEKPTKEQKQRAKEDYRRFFQDDEPKGILYYSEKSGFYKYFQDQIEELLRQADHVIHYVTSDPDDQVFQLKNPRLIPYYIDDNRLIPLFMKVDACVFIMTTPSIGIYHLKRSLVNKRVEYIYTPHDPLSVHMSAEKGSFDHFDTIFCVGRHQEEELQALEKEYNLPEKTLVQVGYPLIDGLIAQYQEVTPTQTGKKKILIAPSWQEGNILEGSIHPLLEGLLNEGFDITVRPHPEFMKRNRGDVQALIHTYQDRLGEDFRFETDFSSNATVFTADLVITDWSGIAFEFSYATKKPCLFINTPMKVMNPEYQRIPCVPIEISLRDCLGVSLEPDHLDGVKDTVTSLLAAKDTYREEIPALMEQYLFHIGHSKEIAASYILETVAKKQK